MTFKRFFHHGLGIVMTRGIRFSVAVLAMLFAFGGQSQAGVVNATFLSTVGSNYGVDNVSFGDTFRIVVAMDNGGSDTLNQTWGVNDIVDVTFDFNNGAHKTVFAPMFSTFSGGFVTNGAGLLTAVPDFSSGLATVISENSSQIPISWYINGLNDVYYTLEFPSFSTRSVGLVDPTQNQVASNWTIAPAAAVPEPSTIAVLGIGMSAFVVNVARRRRNTKQQGAMV